MNIVSRYKSWTANRNARHTLNALSDRQLDDIGLCRADIPTAGIRFL